MHHYAINLRNKEANCWDMGHMGENPLGAAQPAQQPSSPPVDRSPSDHHVLRAPLSIQIDAAC